MDRLVKIPDTLTGPCMLMKKTDKTVNLSGCKTRFNICLRYHKVRLKTLFITTEPSIYCESLLNDKLVTFRRILMSPNTCRIHKFSLITLFENFMIFCPLMFKRHFLSHQTIRPVKFCDDENFTYGDKRRLSKLPVGKWYHRKKKRKFITEPIGLTAKLRGRNYRF